MASKTLEERVQKLESTLHAVQEQLAEQVQEARTNKRGWRWFVGIDADNPHFDEAVRFGREWRFSDRPAEHETNR
jgi:hypothetical protein